MLFQKKKGFTLIELVVVIAILALLMAILIPAVQSSREAARRTTCINKQRTLARAVMEYEVAKKKFPMGLNIIPLRHTNKSTIRYRSQQYLLNKPYTMVAWHVMLFPYTELLPVWENLTQKVDETTDESVRKPLDLMLSGYWCPSAGAQDICQISYVCNAGYNDMPWGYRNWDLNKWKTGTQAEYLVGDITKFEGIFHDGKDPKYCEPLKQDDIKDGLSSTLMISENLQFNDVWTNMENIYGFCWPYYRTQDENWNFNDSFTCVNLAKAHVYLPPTDLIAPGPYANQTGYGYGYHQTPMRINRCGRDIIGSRAWLTARPSSAHPRVVVAAMADGSVRPINEDLDMLIYAGAMTTWDKKSRCTQLHTRVFQSSELD